MQRYYTGMKYFIVSDIHGCYYTFVEILKHWKPNEEKLIVLGDFVNKGKHTFAVIEYLTILQKLHKNNVIILKGNNEHLFYLHYSEFITLTNKQKFENYNLPYNTTLDWINDLPHFWENNFIFASHAGVSQELSYPIKNVKNDRFLTNRNPLKNINKTQFLGHVVVDKPIWDENANAWYLDTGAGLGNSLTAAIVTAKGGVEKFITYKVNSKDIAKVYS